MHDIGPLPPLEKRHFSLLSGEQKQRQPAAAVTLKSGRKVNGIFITDTISDAPGVQRQENTEEKTANLSLFGKVSRDGLLSDRYGGRFLFLRL